MKPAELFPLSPWEGEQEVRGYVQLDAGWVEVRLQAAGSYMTRAPGNRWRNRREPLWRLLNHEATQ